MREKSLILTFDEKDKKLKFFTAKDADVETLKTTFITEVSMDQLQSIPVERAIRSMGENIFITMESLRPLLRK